MAYIIIGLILLWFFIAIVLPYMITPNFKFKKHIKKSKKIEKIAKKLKDKNKEKTLRNVYHYVIKHYDGDHHQFNPASIVELLEIPKFKIEKKLALKEKKFLWCYAQNLIIKSLLINSEQFSTKYIKFKKNLGKHFVIHQYLIVKIKNIRYKVDPFYNIFKKI